MTVMGQFRPSITNVQPSIQPKMLKHVKRQWNETRGDQYDGWGTSWWYFEVADDGRVTRQVEQYVAGALLHYDLERDADAYGHLAAKPLDPSESGYIEIPDEEFEQIWERAKSNAVR